MNLSVGILRYRNTPFYCKDHIIGKISKTVKKDDNLLSGYESDDETPDEEDTFCKYEDETIERQRNIIQEQNKQIESLIESNKDLYSKLKALDLEVRKLKTMVEEQHSSDILKQISEILLTSDDSKTKVSKIKNILTDINLLDEDFEIID